MCPFSATFFSKYYTVYKEMRIQEDRMLFDSFSFHPCFALGDLEALVIFFGPLERCERLRHQICWVKAEAEMLSIKVWKEDLHYLMTTETNINMQKRNGYYASCSLKKGTLRK